MLSYLIEWYLPNGIKIYAELVDFVPIPIDESIPKSVVNS